VPRVAHTHDHDDRDDSCYEALELEGEREQPLLLTPPLKNQAENSNRATDWRSARSTRTTNYHAQPANTTPGILLGFPSSPRGQRIKESYGHTAIHRFPSLPKGSRNLRRMEFIYLSRSILLLQGDQGFRRSNGQIYPSIFLRTHRPYTYQFFFFRFSVFWVG
jgi:hypothetical protein